MNDVLHASLANVKIASLVGAAPSLNSSCLIEVCNATIATSGKYLDTITSPLIVIDVFHLVEGMLMQSYLCLLRYFDCQVLRLSCICLQHLWSNFILLILMIGLGM